ncbi:Cmx/CmrA family chloramphenicol efflux MFS transporter [Pseudonocardia kunmingensis]|uniref:DHA1 family chloramphenicol resistance protein-like MFS transporter n=1 Tax=Pseudonocardia kunmingensis TaxID=630975 RepID=A0A543E3Q4_9PSEU|nr:Cmx/CmrA family chloramphenicol efflux MFS transporter [Pseudonocardia kunmingensis]TQM16216.1 DHA1 family chloramphenicol resistance protein-like MFS transporter [Pseudonocardia kunmingensis]
MPFVLHLLALAVFAQGTSEFMLSGLVQDIAADLDVSLPAAGLLTSAFAVGMVIGAPLMAVLSMRWSQRRSLLTFLCAFVGVHVVGAVTTSYEVLLATRVVAALANAGFLAVALVTAVGMVTPSATGRATSVLLAGTTLACVAGVPAGAVLGQAWGWRSAFWAVALVSVPALAGILRWVPARAPGAAAPGARRELRVLRRPRLLVVLLLGALVNGGTFCALTYLAPLVTDVAGLAVGWVPAVLALFGIGSFAGVTVAGRLGDAHPVRLLAVGGVLLLAGWVGFALVAANPAASSALVLVQGGLGFAVGATLIAQALRAATGAPTLAGAFATGAFNVGAALGPWLGGLAIAAGPGPLASLWVSAAMVAPALAIGAAAHALQRAAAPAPAA